MKRRNVGFLTALALSLTAFTGVVEAEEPDAPPTPTVTIAPVETKEVVAEGRAAINRETGVIGARQAAIGQALRAAVEKALGVYVSARTLTQNYQMVRDQVLTRSDGYATLKEIVREQVGTQEVRVTVRALVSLRPLAKQLKALRLTRTWRVRVSAKLDNRAGKTEADNDVSAGAVAALENTLADAGFVVVSDAKDADIAVQIAPKFVKIADIPAETGSFSATMHSIRGDVTAKALRVGTGEVVAALSASDTQFNVSAAAARTQAATDAAKNLAPRLADALLVLPAANAQPITLVVSGLKSASQAAKLEDSLNALTGVQRVTRRTYANGSATWELDVMSEAVSLLPRSLEQNASLRRFRLTIASENRSKVVAVAK